MSQIDSVKEKILEQADIAEVVSQYVRLQPKGGRLFGLCPFHTEKTPSFSVAPEKGFFHCFGCGKGGNVIDFIIGVENLTYAEARALLAQRLNIPLEAPSGVKRPHEEIDRHRVMDFAARYYAKCLETSESAKGYLEGRGLTGDSIKRFGLGFAPPGWENLLAALRNRNVPEAVMLELGLVVPRPNGPGVYDRFRNRVMFPIRNTLSRVIAFGGRALDPNDQAKYLNSSDTPLFNKSKVLYLLDQAKNVLKDRGALVVEGYMDAISLHIHGFTQTVAGLGTALTAEHVRLLRRYTNDVVLLYDGDEAGTRAARRAVENFFQAGLPVRVALLPQGVDPDDFVRQQGNEAMQSLLESARDGFQFAMALAMKDRNLSDPRDKQAIVEDLAPLLGRIPDALVRGDYVRSLAERLGSDSLTLQKSLQQKMKIARLPAREAENEPAIEASRQERSPLLALKETLLRLIALHYGFNLPEEMTPAQRPWLLSEEDWNSTLPGYIETLGEGDAIDAILLKLLRNKPESGRIAHISQLSALLPDEKEAALFLRVVNEESMPKTEKDLRKMKDQIVLGFENERKKRQEESILRHSDDTRKTLEEMNRMLFPLT